MNPYDILNDIREDHISSLDISADLKRRRQRKVWKENREEFLSDTEVCEWCGEKPDSFDVHHSWSRDLGRQWIHASDEAFTQSESFDPSLTENKEGCPNCMKKDYYKRKTKDPTYRCNSCGEEFDEPKEIDGKNIIVDDKFDTKPYMKNGYIEAKAEWAEDNAERIKKAFLERYQSLLDEYMNLREDQVVAICSSCHYKEEQTSLKRCNSCGKNWHKRNKPQCWDCIVKEKGLEECDCGDGWYDPSSYDSCSNCR